MARDVEDALLRVVEGTPDIQALPLTRDAESGGALPELLAQGEGRAREGNGTVLHKRVAEHPGHLEGREFDGAALDPGDLTRRRGDESTRSIEDLV